jgi:hypothetical protein
MASSAQQVLKEGTLCVPLEDNSCFQCKAKQLGHSIVHVPISKRYDLPGMRRCLPRGRGRGRLVGRGGRFVEAGSVITGSVATVEGLTMEGSAVGVKYMDAERDAERRSSSS